MHILLFGQNGQLGWELQRALAPLGRVTALSKKSVELCGDFLDPAGIAKTIRILKPDIIVNAVGYTAVDQAESEKYVAQCINSISVEVIAREANFLGALLIHYSTDYVFDGAGYSAWSEIDKPSPINFYGKSKLDGELAVQSLCDRHLIIRTSWIYSSRGDNFIKNILRLAKKRDSLEIVNDQYGAPTGADLIADCSAHMISAVVKGSNPYGIYHVTASGSTTRYEYAVFIIQRVLNQGEELKVKNIIPIHSNEYPQKALRPHNSTLNTEKFQMEFGLVLPVWQFGVERVLAGCKFNYDDL
ncbi:dTDP-4-dehydrorhamnose reductase [Plesiomonas shigelloides]|uniref:dTDP-4-dehydrorhamnose reductase n=1 Tax=Plesiomonas shigelloides TaxID=703 RepID=UPI000D98CDBD|nr:dTDP-4-dehydrorhamnose reductase [Plesiomonas shigelloides]SPZ44229.1 dTDP-4-dehydrorhamnose reductase [Plesiomonas shigelloides]